MDMPWLKMKLKSEDFWLNFVIENSVLTDYAEPGNKDKSGIGIQNARKRLDLLYPGKYVLRINEKPGSFSAELKLDLKS